MNLISVQSSNIAQIGFEINRMNSMNAKPINVLRIVFVNGGIFDYYNVSKQDYENFLKSESKGAYFHKFIKNVYSYEKVS